MAILIDIDSTISDYENGIIKPAEKHLKENYGLDKVHDDLYMIEDIFEIDRLFIGSNLSGEERELKKREIIGDVWKKNYRNYRDMNFVDGAKDFVKQVKEDKHQVVFLATKEKHLQGEALYYLQGGLIAQQLERQGFTKANILLFPDEVEKFCFLYDNRNEGHVLIDDRASMLIASSKLMNVKCINAKYNQNRQIDDVLRYDDFNDPALLEAINSQKDRPKVKQLKKYPSKI